MTGVPRVARRDVLIALGFTALLILDVAFNDLAKGAFASDAPLYGAAGMVLVWRRRFPVPALVACMTLVLLGTVAGTDVPDLNASLLFLALPTYAIANTLDGPWTWVGLAVAVAFLAVLTLISDHHLTGDSFGFPLGIEVASFAAGRLLRNRALMTRTLADEAARLELDRDLRAQAAVGEERARIAREMHDVVAHTMAIMVIQAGGARRVLDRDPAAAERALATVEDTGRVALTELRRLLGFLREDAPAELAPQPSLEDIGALVQRARDAGLPVELRTEGEPGELPAGAELAAYRIVQEALTNTMKHAGAGARATVTVRWTATELELEVRDRGGAPNASQAGGRHGIVGMRERVALYGGTVEAGPAEGGFAVRARLPRRAAVAA